MALDNFTPEIWAREILFYLDKSLVWAQEGVVNRDYEGEISQAGDTVHINQVGPVTVGDYTKNTAITDPEVLTSTQRDLVIDQAKFVNFMVDDIDAAQNRPKVMQTAMGRAAYGLRDVADQYVAGLYTGVAAANVIGTDAAPITITPTGSTSAYDQLVDLGTALDEANVPTEGRWAIAAPAFVNMLAKDDRFTSSGDGASAQVRRNGFAGSAAGFDVMKSNNSPSATSQKVVTGIPAAISYAEQIPVSALEAYRPEKFFSDAVKGLHLYGAKLVEPSGIAVLHYTI
ncbi:P22 coat protein - protein 5 domain protein [Streptomonospora sp. PA3]|uniref:P22 phage major capsid protein family protein n=1 Tax=Streptomonospora sp. PA3 TaxID=2607326 RepID=UPI0012DF66FF|nr:P22 phage major capsid protein family protein [Streptomonospora sp. PA3]MUL39626.1 P22 coat protein - protein 5 domain protein [Streptomonospora sp. PA3]